MKSHQAVKSPNFTKEFKNNDDHMFYSFNKKTNINSRLTQQNKENKKEVIYFNNQISTVSVFSNQNQNNINLNVINSNNQKNKSIFNQNQKQKLFKADYEYKVKQFIENHLTCNNVFKQGVLDIQYMTGSYYIGQVQKNKNSINKNQPNEINQQINRKNGYGVYYFSNGDIYFGLFLNNQFHKQGTYIFNNDQYFIGIFKQGQSIRGEYHYKNKNVFIGQFKNAKPNGYGKIFFSNQFNQKFKNSKNKYFQGYFVDGLQQGNGKLLVDNQFFLQGIWKNGCLIKGKILYLNTNNVFKQFYQGNFQNQRFQGQGKYVFSPNSQYIGSFLNGKFHGKGKLFYENGDLYEGNFQDGKRHGFGIYQYKNGEKYIGNWKFNLKSGKGVIQLLNGQKIQRLFIQDKIQ